MLFVTGVRGWLVGAGGSRSRVVDCEGWLAVWVGWWPQVVGEVRRAGWLVALGDWWRGMIGGGG